MERFHRAKKQGMPGDITVLYEVPSNYDSNAAPEGKQIILAATCSPTDPRLTENENMPWWNKIDEIMFHAFPDLAKNIEAKECYSSREVSMLSRDHVLPGQGGECIGLAQAVGQTDLNKPAVKAPLQGLFYVGCDAGGIGIGTQQAVDSGIKVADIVKRYHLMKFIG